MEKLGALFGGRSRPVFFGRKAVENLAGNLLSVYYKTKKKGRKLEGKGKGQPRMIEDDLSEELKVKW